RPAQSDPPRSPPAERFTVRCPGYGRPVPLSAAEAKAGVRLECAACNTIFRVSGGPRPPGTGARGPDVLEVVEDEEPTPSGPPFGWESLLEEAFHTLLWLAVVGLLYFFVYPKAQEVERQYGPEGFVGFWLGFLVAAGVVTGV